MAVDSSLVDFGLCVDCLDITDNYLAVSCSNLGGDYWDGLVSVFDLKAHKKLNIDWRSNIGFASICWCGSSEKRLLAVAMDNGCVQILEFPSNKERKQEKNCLLTSEILVCHDDIVTAVCTKPKSGDVLASASWDRRVLIIPYGIAPYPSDTFTGHTGAVNSIDWSSLSTSCILSGSQDKSIQVWDYRSGANASFKWSNDFSVTSVKWHPNQSFLCFAGLENGAIATIDIRGNQECLLENEMVHLGPVNSISLNKSASQIATASDDTTIVIRSCLENTIDDNSLSPCTLRHHNDYVRSVQFYERKNQTNTHTLISASWDQTVAFSTISSLVGENNEQTIS